MTQFPTHLRLSRTLLVTLSFDGPRIQGLGLGERHIALAPADLLLLGALDAGTGVQESIAEVAASTGCAPETLTGLVGALIERGLLRSEAPVGGRHLPVDLHPKPSVRWGEHFVLLLPMTFAVDDGRYVYVDHHGCLRLTMAPREMAAASVFITGRAFEDGYAAHSADLGPARLDPSEWADLVERLCESGLLQPYDPAALAKSWAEMSGTVGSDGPAESAKATSSVGGSSGGGGDPSDATMDPNWQTQRLGARINSTLAALDEIEDDLEADSGKRRTPVWPIAFNGATMPLALGMIMSYLRVHDGGRLNEDFQMRPDWIASGRWVTKLVERRGVFLYSNYMWSSPACLGHARQLKEHSPQSLVVFGGPDVPGFPGDSEKFLEDHRFVDVIVRGEGEETAAELLTALVGSLDRDRFDLGPLEDVAGLVFRHGEHTVRTPDRDRIADLDVIPSPFLDGMFEAFGEGSIGAATIETNRGCPYGCTFCDWGSATRSRIRKFDLDRVLSELEWCARNSIGGVGFADANFGIFERDVVIAEKLAELKSEYGWPRSCGTNFAKNTVKHLSKIVSAWADAGLVTQGMLSLQTSDAGTLTAIRRTDIKVERYNELEKEFRSKDLPLFVDLMMGLPGQTVGAMLNDLQDIIDRDVTAKIHPTVLLTNSPMNEPSYRETYAIEAEDAPAFPGSPIILKDVVVASSTFTRAEYQEMQELRMMFLLCENCGALRHVSRFVHQQTSVREIDFYDGLRRDVKEDSERWPLLNFTLFAVPDLMAPPMSWGLLMSEVRRYLDEKLGIAPDSALDTVLRVQQAVLPAPDRHFPETIELEHDYARWHLDRLAARDRDESWVDVVPPLREYAPATFTVDDPHLIHRFAVGKSASGNYMMSWELESPVARPLMARTGA